MTVHDAAERAAPILVLGAGAWGTALALVAARAGHRVYLWGRDPMQVANLVRARENARYLPGISLPELIAPIADLAALPSPLTTAILAVPLRATRDAVDYAVGHGVRDFACAAKGMELASELLVHEIVRSIAPHTTVALLSGPSFAREVALGRPTAITVAASTPAFGQALVYALHGPGFRPYLSDDLLGVAVGGAVKNVLAIAAGIADGLGLGVNSRAALITRGLAEIARFGVKLGGRHETFMGLSGLGDVVLTCTDDQSRNRRFGLALGRGATVAAAHVEVGLAEGVATSIAVAARAAQLGVDMPITVEVARAVRGETTPAQAVQNLLARELPKPYG